MNQEEAKDTHWTICPECHGTGKKRQRLRKKVRLNYQRAVEHFNQNGQKGTPPTKPKAHLSPCPPCSGSGIVATTSPPQPKTNHYPHVAIVGGGIGGVALAVACLHRGIPFTLYERDRDFEARSQGYGLTLQQASKAIEGLGIIPLEEGVISTRHVVHTTDGKVIGEWGMRKWLELNKKSSSKRTNIHIARQALRLALLKQLGDSKNIRWGHQLVNFKKTQGKAIELNFEVDGILKTNQADLLVGADGIRSSVRRLLIGEEKTPLRYLGCIVILGICKLSSLESFESELLDSATVFQTANGNERIYMMPYSSNAVMWQLSFPMPEEKAKNLSALGAEALKEEAIRRTPWHSPIPQILKATNADQVSGYPVYDRELLYPELLQNAENITLIGDAAHPMSPFKGQGANQALLNALALARAIYKGCRPNTNWKENDLRASILNAFETEMMKRSAKKVEDSAEAAEFLHSDIVLQEANTPRGKLFKK